MTEAVGPLTGRTVLVTRPRERAASLTSALESLGAEVISRPTIAFEPSEDQVAVADAMRDLADYDWIVFTSPTGVRFFSDRLNAVGAEVSLQTRLAAVGPGTARVLNDAVKAPAVTAGDSHAEGLATALREHVRAGERVLVVRPESASAAVIQALDEIGARPEPVAFYRTVAAPDVAELASAVIREQFDAAVFTSPSTFERLLDGAGAAREPLARALGRMAIVAIGGVTADAMRRAGLEPREAVEPTPAGLADAVSRCFPVRPDPVVPCGPFPGGSDVSRSDTIQQTPLHDQHVEAGGRMVDFSGWRMPVQYQGVIDEHLAVRKQAGLFDVSHMGEASVRGPQALDYLQKLTCNDVSRLRAGRAQYTALTSPVGTFVDDLLIYMLADDDYLLVINAANTPKDIAWLQQHAGSFDVEVCDASSDWAQLAVQGPRAAECVRPLVGVSLEEIKYYRFARTEVDGVSCILSRTGYTGEDGFEIYGPSGAAPQLWNALMARGADEGLVPVGLGARDTLRLEAKLALYGNDIDETTTVLEADLGWIVKFKKGDFIGRDVLAAQKAEGVRRTLIGFEMRGRAIARHGYETLHAGNVVGRVTSGTRAPFLGKNIGLAYLPVELCETGTEFAVGIRGREEPAVVVPTPFYKRDR